MRKEGDGAGRRLGGTAPAASECLTDIQITHNGGEEPVCRYTGSVPRTRRPRTKRL
jgi:hypothetical protein